MPSAHLMIINLKGQLTVERFRVECEAAQMRISTSKSETMILMQERVACPLWVRDELRHQVEVFKYTGVVQGAGD